MKLLQSETRIVVDLVMGQMKRRWRMHKIQEPTSLLPGK
jgi:hypothetical protein